MKNPANQMFRFCCRCAQMTLIKKGKCITCNGQFVLTGKKDDMLIRGWKFSKKK